MNFKQWAYVQLHGNRDLQRACGLKMLYLALAGAYANGDLDFVADLTERIKARIG